MSGQLIKTHGIIDQLVRSETVKEPGSKRASVPRMVQVIDRSVGEIGKVQLSTDAIFKRLSFGLQY